MSNFSSRPLLYSFRRCPYAMRARLAIAGAGFDCQLREIILRDKPAHMLEISPKGTVPVLQLPNGHVIEESIEIMQYVLEQSDPHQWLGQNEEEQQDIKGLIAHNDGDFKKALDRYKYTDRYEDAVHEDEQQKCLKTLTALNHRLGENIYLCADRQTLADWAIMPFIRQCRIANIAWFDAQELPHLHKWLKNALESALFLSVMTKYPQWQEGDDPTPFPPQA